VPRLGELYVDTMTLKVSTRRPVVVLMSSVQGLLHTAIVNRD
jgi:hypothetical protein